jgi:hypothetical protein
MANHHHQHEEEEVLGSSLINKQVFVHVLLFFLFKWKQLTAANGFLNGKLVITVKSNSNACPVILARSVPAIQRML